MAPPDKISFAEQLRQALVQRRSQDLNRQVIKNNTRMVEYFL